MQALQKALDWLAEQPEDAAELAALLSEAAPKLGFNAQKSKIPGISRAATSRKSLELLHADMTLMQRLQAARPMLVGASSCLSSWTLSHCEMPLINCLVSWSEYDTSALTATMKPADKTGSECGAQVLPMKCSGLVFCSNAQSYLAKLCMQSYELHLDIQLQLPTTANSMPRQVQDN